MLWKVRKRENDKVWLDISQQWWLDMQTQRRERGGCKWANEYGRGELHETLELVFLPSSSWNEQKAWSKGPQAVHSWKLQQIGHRSNHRPKTVYPHINFITIFLHILSMLEYRFKRIWISYWFPTGLDFPTGGHPRLAHSLISERKVWGFFL